MDRQEAITTVVDILKDVEGQLSDGYIFYIDGEMEVEECLKEIAERIVNDIIPLTNEGFATLLEEGEQIELEICLHKCPVCLKKIGRGRILGGGRKTIYCPGCKIESEVT